MKLQFINLEKISDAETFRYHIEPTIPELHQSIQDQGILMPLFLSQGEDLLVVDGFRRFESAKKIGLHKIPVIIFPQKKIENTFIQALHLNLQVNKLSVIEKFFAFSVARNLFTDETQTRIKKYLDFDRIPGTENILQYILSLPHSLKKLIHTNNYSLRVLGKLSQFDYDRYENWLKLALKLNFNGSEISTLFEQIRDISLKDNIEPSKLLDKMEIQKLLNSRLSPGHQCQYIKRRVAEYRMPLQTTINAKLHRFSKDFEQAFNGQVRVGWDKNLENTGISLTLIMSNEQTADKIIKKLHREKIRTQILEMICTSKYLPEESS